MIGRTNQPWGQTKKRFDTHDNPHHPSNINLLRRVAPARRVRPFLFVPRVHLVEGKSDDCNAEDGVPIILRRSLAG